MNQYEVLFHVNNANATPGYKEYVPVEWHIPTDLMPAFREIAGKNNCLIDHIYPIADNE